MFRKYACKSSNANNKNYDAYSQLQTISTKSSKKILRKKENNDRKLYDKLNDPNSSSKSYWPVLKTIYNGISNPINRTHLNQKQFYIKLFGESKPFQCTPIANDSTLPLVTTPANNASLSPISFNNQDILKHFLNINKTYGHDYISIRLLKICDSSIVRPLSIIFRNCLQSGSFPNNWKNSNTVSIHKKGNK